MRFPFLRRKKVSTLVANPSHLEPLEQRQLLSGTVSGLITDASGTALVDAKVRLIPATPTPGDYDLFATTDSSGDYVINDVTDGSYTVRARDKGYVPNTSTSFTVADGANTAPTVALTAIVTGTVTGQITDSTGTPLVDARVVLKPASAGSPTPMPHDGWGGWDRYGLFATTDANGDYVIDNVVAGAYTICVHDQGYVPSKTTTLTVAAGTNTATTVKLTAIVYGTVTGEVTDTTGTALSDAHVTLTLASTTGATFGGRFTATTDASGDYILTNVPTGAYDISARDHGYTPSTATALTVAAGANTAATIKLAPIVYGTVTGLVTDSGGTPIADAWVTLIAPVSMSSSGPSDIAFLGGRRYFAQTDSSGDYTIDNVQSGSYTADASASGYIAGSSASFTVGAGTTTAPTIKLTAIVYATVTGQITDSSGNPLSDARVFLLPSGVMTPGPIPLFGGGDVIPQLGLFATTDASGDYTIDNVPTGSYTVTANDRGYAPNTSAAFTVTAGTNTAPTVALTASTTPPWPIPMPWGGDVGDSALLG